MLRSSGLSQYYFEVSIDQWDLYMKHIIEGIYGVKEANCRIIQGRDEILIVEIETNPNIPLINSLPATIIRESAIVYHSNKTLVAIVDEKIRRTFTDFLHPVGTYYTTTNKVTLAPFELKPIIMQLARDRKINKFIELTQERFLIYIAPFIAGAIIKVIDNILTITIYARIDSTFDVDDGYTGILTELNPIWIKWKEAGNITAPIHSPNYV